MIGLPANIFFGTGIPTIIMVLKQKRQNTDVLIIDASKGFEKVGKNNKLRASDIKKIVDVVTARITVPKFSRVVSRDEIRANDYNLNIPRYVDSSEKPESWDIYASMFGGIPASEANDLGEYWDAFPGLKSSLFDDENAPYLHFISENIKQLVSAHPSVRSFRQSFTNAFSGFDAWLADKLLTGMHTINISREESELADEIFRRLASVPLVDKYEAYQLLDNEWNRIAVDLEIIQTEGFDAAKKVDPNMVTKKKDGKDVEVQDGWIGHVIPFDLAQKKYLSDELTALQSAQDGLAEIMGEYEALLDELPEEEKEKDFVNEDKTAFVPAEVKKALKAKDADAEVLSLLKRYDNLNKEEKELKKQIKELDGNLLVKTKSTIELLSDEQTLELIREKWISPVINGLSRLPDDIVNAFASQLEALQKKYETTFFDIEQQIDETEQSLIGLLDDLTGSEYDMQGLAEFRKLLGGC